MGENLEFGNIEPSRFVVLDLEVRENLKFCNNKLKNSKKEEEQLNVLVLCFKISNFGNKVLDQESPVHPVSEFRGCGLSVTDIHTDLQTYRQSCVLYRIILWLSFQRSRKATLLRACLGLLYVLLCVNLRIHGLLCIKPS